MTAPQRDGPDRSRDIRDSNITLGISAVLGIITFTVAAAYAVPILFFCTIATFVYGLLLRRHR